MTALIAASVGLITSGAAQAVAEPQRVIIDQDMINNVDDAGALAVAFALEKKGEAEVLAVTTNTNYKSGTTGKEAQIADASWKCQAAIANFYGRSDVPRGVMDSATRVPDGSTSHVQACANLAGNVSAPKNASEVIVKALEESPDNSVVLIGNGYFANYGKLLNNATTKALVAKKVNKLVAMAGKYPSGKENNIQNEVASADNVAKNWPTEIVWVGSEVGEAITAGTGISQSHPAGSPVRAVYENLAKDRVAKSSDLVAAYRAIRPNQAGLGDSARGVNVITTVDAPTPGPTSGTNTFVVDPDPATPGQDNQHYTTLSDQAGVTSAIDSVLNAKVWPASSNTTTTTSTVPTTTSTTTTTTVPGGQTGGGAEADGYRLVRADGAVETHGVNFHGDMSGKPLNAPIINAVRTGENKGYWLLGLDGGIFSFGDAKFHGSMGGQPLNMPIVGMASTPSGNGYWLVALDGGVFAFGDAKFHGSMAGEPLNMPVVGITSTPDGKGYWLVAADGGIFSFGNAGFYGSMGGKPLNEMIVGMTSGPEGKGYRLVAEDGGIFSFGAPFHGSMGGKYISAPIVGMTPTTDNQGYWIVGLDGAVYPFGNATVVGRTGGNASDIIVVALA